MSPAPDSTRARQRSYATHAVILRRRDQGDADRILTIFTPGFGKRQVIAKGIRKPSSRKAGHVELFAHTNLQIARARTWDIVTEAVMVEPFKRLRSDLEGIGRAGYLCELVDCFTEEEDENQLIWDLLLLGLRQLDQIDLATVDHNRAAVFLRWFELQMLTVTGFQPQFFHCLDCGRNLAPETNFLLLHEGGVVCPDCRSRRNEGEELVPDVLKILRFLQSRSWSDVSRVSIRPAILQQVQSILYRYLVVVLERQLRSTDFLRRLEHGRLY